MKKEKIKNKKSNTKKLVIIIVVLLIIVILTILGILINKKDNNENKKTNEKLNEEQKLELKEYLTLNNQTIYLYNMDEINIIYEEKDLSLQDFVKESDNLNNTFSIFEEYLDVQKVLKDGGTTFYKTKKSNEFFKEELTIIKCNTLDGNKDIYIGKNYNPTEALKSGACGKNFFSDKSFTRVYTINNILEKDENETHYLLELTISDDNKNEVKIIRSLDKEMRSILKKKTKYTFYFENTYGELIKEDMEEIFDKCSLTGIVPYGK